MSEQEEGWVDVKCRVCDQESGEEEFCQLHLKTYTRIIHAYEAWKKGLRISWEDYLRRIRDNSLTGKWAKEVAEYLINKEEEENVKES